MEVEGRPFVISTVPHAQEFIERRVSTVWAGDTMSLSGGNVAIPSNPLLRRDLLLAPGLVLRNVERDMLSLESVRPVLKAARVVAEAQHLMDNATLAIRGALMGYKLLSILAYAQGKVLLDFLNEYTEKLWRVQLVDRARKSYDDYRVAGTFSVTTVQNEQVTEYDYSLSDYSSELGLTPIIKVRTQNEACVISRQIQIYPNGVWNVKELAADLGMDEDGTRVWQWD